MVVDSHWQELSIDNDLDVRVLFQPVHDLTLDSFTCRGTKLVCFPCTFRIVTTYRSSLQMVERHLQPKRASRQQYLRASAGCASDPASSWCWLVCLALVHLVCHRRRPRRGEWLWGSYHTLCTAEIHRRCRSQPSQQEFLHSKVPCISDGHRMSIVAVVVVYHSSCI